MISETGNRYSLNNQAQYGNKGKGAISGIEPQRKRKRSMGPKTTTSVKS
jgi:hypothetical protein